MAENRTPYAQHPQTDLILRDHLAIDRTVLANERTFLAYVRTSLAFLVVGGSILKFFTGIWIHVAGLACLVLSAAFLGIGIKHYRAFKQAIDAIRDPR